MAPSPARQPPEPSPASPFSRSASAAQTMSSASGRTNGNSSLSLSSNSTGTIPKRRPSSSAAATAADPVADMDDLDGGSLGSLLDRLRHQQQDLRSMQSHQARLRHHRESSSSFRGQTDDVFTQSEPATSASVRITPDPQIILNDLARLEGRLSQVPSSRLNYISDSDFGAPTSNDFEALLTEKMEVVKKLRELESEKKHMDEAIKQFYLLSLESDVSRVRKEASPRARPSLELGQLKHRLLELQSTIAALERPLPVRGSVGQQDGLEHNRDFAHLEPTRQLIQDMQEQGRLHRELSIRRRELEELTQKDLSHLSDQKNESKEFTSSRSGHGRFLHPLRSSSGCNSDINSEVFMRPLSVSSIHSLPVSESTSRPLRSVQPTAEAYRRLREDFSSVQTTLQQQQVHLQQLTQSVMHSFESLVEMQHEVVRLQRTVEANEARGRGSSCRHSCAQSASAAAAERAFGLQPGSAETSDPRATPNSASRPRGDMNTLRHPSSSLYEFGVDPILPSNLSHSSQRENWVTPLLQAASDSWPYRRDSASNDSNLNEYSEMENLNDLHPGVVALNNQVLPAMRANNYWDNFRSFSHQNRLSSALTASSLPTGSALPLNNGERPQMHGRGSPSPGAPSASAATSAAVSAANVAQVTPRQVSLSSSPSAAEQRHAREPLVFASLSSPPRQRRKQKINREQNREVAATVGLARRSSNHEGATAVRVFPMPHVNEERNLNADVNSLTRSIYDQVNSLIAESGQQPDQLARLFRSLQSFGTRGLADGANVNENNALWQRPPRAEVGVEPASASRGGEPLVLRRLGLARGECREARPLVEPSSRTFANHQMYAEDDNMGSGVRSEGQDRYLDRESEAREPFYSFDSYRRSDEAADFAVPKNVQRSLVTRRGRHERPRNMQEAADDLSGESERSDSLLPLAGHVGAADHDRDFVPIQLDFHPRVRLAAPMMHAEHQGHECDMTEADQDQSPVQAEARPPVAGHGGVRGGDDDDDDDAGDLGAVARGPFESSARLMLSSLSPLGFLNEVNPEQGLDRVPTRLSANELEQQRQAEEANMQSLVDEVLNTSSDSELVEESLPVPREE